MMLSLNWSSELSQSSPDDDVHADDVICLFPEGFAGRSIPGCQDAFPLMVISTGEVCVLDVCVMCVHTHTWVCQSCNIQRVRQWVLTLKTTVHYTETNSLHQDIMPRCSSELLAHMTASSQIERKHQSHAQWGMTVTWLEVWLNPLKAIWQWKHCCIFFFFSLSLPCGCAIVHFCEWCVCPRCGCVSLLTRSHECFSSSS